MDKSWRVHLHHIPSVRVLFKYIASTARKHTQIYVNALFPLHIVYVLKNQINRGHTLHSITYVLKNLINRGHTLHSITYVLKNLINRGHTLHSITYYLTT
jgi:hypothetical protein